MSQAMKQEAWNLANDRSPPPQPYFILDTSNCISSNKSHAEALFCHSSRLSFYFGKLRKKALEAFANDASPKPQLSSLIVCPDFRPTVGLSISCLLYFDSKLCDVLNSWPGGKLEPAMLWVQHICAVWDVFSLQRHHCIQVPSTHMNLAFFSGAKSDMRRYWSFGVCAAWGLICVFDSRLRWLPVGSFFWLPEGWRCHPPPLLTYTHINRISNSGSFKPSLWSKDGYSIMAGEELVGTLKNDLHNLQKIQGNFLSCSVPVSTLSRFLGCCNCFPTTCIDSFWVLRSWSSTGLSVSLNHCKVLWWFYRAHTSLMRSQILSM